MPLPRVDEAACGQCSERDGMFGYLPDGTGFITTWDQAEPGQRFSFAQDRRLQIRSPR